jgi:hypothetical protein
MHEMEDFGGGENGRKADPQYGIEASDDNAVYQELKKEPEFHGFPFKGKSAAK